MQLDSILVASRIDKTLHAKLLKRQRELAKITGVKLSVSGTIRALLAQSLREPISKSSRRAAA